MSTDLLPERVDFRRLAARNTSLQGVLPLVRLSRLAEMLVHTQGEARASLTFQQDEERRYVLAGQVNAELSVICQRCLEPVTVDVRPAVQLVAVWPDADEQQLPVRYDPCPVGEEPVSLFDMMEDELLLALPMVNYHADCCLAVEPEVLVDAPAPRRDNPFQALQVLKARPGKGD